MHMARPSSLAVRSQAVARKVGRHVVRQLRKVVASSNEPLLSVVMPAHNVQGYLEESVRSVLAQDYPNLEIIIVEDGSTDGTAEVAHRLARESRKVQVLQTPGLGPSIARNTGVAQAKGEFLWFVDSDDLVDSRAASKMIGSLRQTGSDFVVVCYRRFNEQRRWAPGHWIVDAHAVDRPAVTLREFPDILVNAVVWSKIFRRSFWDEAAMRFPEGVLYEDQPVSARAYARARTFDVLSDVLYDWRVRTDGSSISQQTKDLADLRQRLRAADDSLEELRSAGLEDVAVERLIQVLSNDLQHSTKHIPEMSADHWSTLVEGVRRLMDHLPQERWAEVPPQHAVLEWLIHKDLRAEAVEFVESDGRDLDRWPTELRDDAFVVRVPFWDHPAVPPAAADGTATLRLRTAVRRAVWESPARLRLEGWAYIAGIDLADHPTTVQLWLQDSTGHVVPLEVVAAQDPEIDRVSKHRWNDYRPSVFHAWVDSEQLRADDTPNDYELWVTVRTGKVERSGPVTGAHMRGSAGAVRTRTSPSGVRARLIASATRTCVVRARALPHMVENVSVVDGAAHVHVRGPFGNATPSMSLRAGDYSVMVEGKASGNGAVFVINPDRIPPMPKGEESVAWIVRLRPESGVKAELDWPDSADPQPVWVAGLRLARTVAGNFGVSQWTSMLTVDEADFGADVLELAGTAHLVADGARIQLADHRGAVSAPVRVDGERWTAAVPLVQDRWAGPMRPLPIGRYQLKVTAADGSAPALVPEGVRELLPLIRSHVSGMYARLETGPRASINLVVEAPLAPEERGARNQERLRQAHINRVPSVRPNTVLLRTYYGESCTDTALAVHHELRRRGGYELYWTVKDHSVIVPEGGIPVVSNSAQWYELWGSAQYTIDNMHEPDFFHKAPGQVVVQTIHGYPFKAAGMRNWEATGVPKARVRSYLRRHDQWDYLVSPAPYATPLLERDFPSTGRTLEIGYPRNDVLLSPQAAQIRERARRILGLPADARVLLYAPTHREYLAETEFKSKMVEFFDAEAAVESLGESWYVLVRGHAMNARTGYERKSSGRVIDVTDYPEISDLCLASDVAVLDYSSLRFDYALTGNPMIFLVPDLESYREARGWLLPYEETAPGPLVENTQELVEQLRGAGDLRAWYADERRKFIDAFMPLEDGQAAARLVDAVMR